VKMTTSPSTRRVHLMSIAEAADFLRVSQKTVRRRIASGELRASRVGSQWRIRAEELDAYLARTGNLQSIGVR